MRRDSFSRDNIDFIAPLVIAVSGWLFLVGYFYFEHVKESRDFYSILFSGDGTVRIWTILILTAPLISSIFGYVLDERLNSYRRQYQRHFKYLFESELRETLDQLILGFVNALDSKSPWTKGHSLRVQHYSLMIAREFELPDDEIEQLSIAALLHDIGKIGTYDDILNKAEALTEEEFILIKKHPDNAVKILGPIRQFNNLLPIIKGHHERIDGQGYPDNLTGDEIPQLARILCVADAFDAITSERPYKSSLDKKQAVVTMQNLAGSQFDSDAVNALVAAQKKPDFDMTI